MNTNFAMTILAISKKQGGGGVKTSIFDNVFEKETANCTLFGTSQLALFVVILKIHNVR